MVCLAVPTIASDKIYRPKYEGGLGIGRIEDLNAILVAN